VHNKFDDCDSHNEKTPNSITLNYGANYGVRTGVVESNMQLYAKHWVINC